MPFQGSGIMPFQGSGIMPFQGCIIKKYYMGQSLVQNYLHIVFSTKYRQKLIFPPYEEELHAYLGGICNSLECQPIKIGGYTDHIHMLCKLSKKIALMKLLEEVKGSSSKWFKTKDESLRNFYWQNGYGAFSVNPAEVDIVISYITNQHSHHNKETFQDEYRRYLNQYEIDYDEQYVWD
jgi:putative transposase